MRREAQVRFLGRGKTVRTSSTRLSAMHGSLVTSSLIRETTENESANEGYRFGQEEETYNIKNKSSYSV